MRKNIETKFLNYILQSPLMPASGPLTSTAENILFFNTIDAGALVTKTISSIAAKVNKPCIYAGEHMVYNSETWSEFPPEKWINDILPRVVKEKNKPLIVSVGYNTEDFNALIPKLDPFADIFEISTHYIQSDLESVVKSILKHTEKPVFMKLSPHIQDYIGFVKKALAAGATGIVAINSLGPGIKIDLEKRSLQIGNESGESWVSGPAIKPYALQRVRAIRQNFPQVPLIAVGGIESGRDVVEFLLAGADSVQMLSGALIHGKSRYQKIINDLPDILEKYNFESIAAVKNSKLSGPIKKENNFPAINLDQCIKCYRCVDVCPTFALSHSDTFHLDENRCIRCGTCESRCPVDAISWVL
jgi:dihydroorotate dehydrogenase subfamily 1